MSITYEWKPAFSLITKNIDNNLDTVIQVPYIITGSDGVNTVEYAGIVQLGVPDSQNFIPFNQLTEDQIITWIEQAVPEEEKIRHKQLISSVLQHKASQPELPSNKPVPWLKPVED